MTYWKIYQLGLFPRKNDWAPAPGPGERSLALKVTEGGHVHRPVLAQGCCLICGKASCEVREEGFGGVGNFPSSGTCLHRPASFEGEWLPASVPRAIGAQ